MDTLFFLGSGDAFCHGDRANQAILVERKNDSLLLDCGPTTKYRFKQTGRDLDRVRTILITHFHGDHFGGLPFLLLYWHYEARRTEPLTLVGPEGLEKALRALVACTYRSLLDRSQYEIRFEEFPLGKVSQKELDDLKVVAYPMRHIKESIGLRLSWDTGDIAITGDTCWNDNIAPLCEGADCLMIECSTYKIRFPEVHLSYEEIQAHRFALTAKRILLHHMDDEMIQASGRLGRPDEVAVFDGYQTIIRP
jgi:ribonuclease BN (tRNA processing enzyme)